MQLQVHASAKESKQQNQTTQQSIPTPAESQTTFEDRRPQSVQLKATKALINASPQQRNLRALQTRMNTGLPVQQLKAQQLHIRQSSSKMDQESSRNKFGTGSESTMPLTGLPPSEPNNTGLFDDLKSEIRNPSEQTQEQMQAKTQPQRNLHGNDRLQLKHEADRKCARTLQMQPVPRPSAKDKSNVTQRSQFSSNAILQLEKKEVQATGITHLVKLNELGSLYQQDFISNEIAETQRGDTIEIDTDEVLRSRRGPNQEIDPLRDKNKDPDNTWTNALSFNKRKLPEKTYIRDGTFEEKTKKEQAEDERKGSLLLEGIPNFV